MRKIQFIIIILIIYFTSVFTGCGPENVEVWKAVPCRLKIINCFDKNTIDVHMLNDDGTINFNDPCLDQI